MTNLSIPFALFAASFAMPSLAQEAAPPALRPARFACDADLDVGVVLVALVDRRVPVFDQWLLGAAIAIPLSPEDDRLAATLAIPAGWSLPLYWQVLGIQPHGELFVGAVKKLGIADDGTLVLDADGRSADEPLVPRSPTVEPLDSDSPVPLAMNLLRDDAGYGIALYAAFVAPTDGYGLSLLDVADNDGDGDAEVYLYRKLPGQGEGTFDVEKKHAVTAKLPGRQKSVHVFVAEGTKSRPAQPIAFRWLARVDL